MVAKLAGVVLILCASVRAAEVPPKELVAYIKDVKKLGLTDEQVRRNAAAAGWSAAIIDDALAATVRGDSGEHTSATSIVSLPDDYRIGPGDVLSISVWKEPDASVPSVTVRADGRISLPLIKEVEVAGLKPSEAERELAARLSRYIRDVDVAVIVTQVNSRKVYLVGAVKNVGTVDLKGGMTILQAITQAGGLTDYAKKKQIYVLRSENGRQTKLPFNYDEVIKGQKMEHNLILCPNDTVVVPQ